VVVKAKFVAAVVIAFIIIVIARAILPPIQFGIMEFVGC
jgi:hypothetical protein